MSPNVQFYNMRGVVTFFCVYIYMLDIVFIDLARPGFKSSPERATKYSIYGDI